MDHEEKVVDFNFDCESIPGVIVNFGPGVLSIFSYMNWMIARCITDISHNVRGVRKYVCCSSDIAGNC
jgi:hypothetical protein